MLGKIAHARGDFDDAERQVSAGLAIKERLAAANPTNPQWQRALLSSLGQLAEVAAAAGASGSAIAHCRRALGIATPLGADQPDDLGLRDDTAAIRKRLVDLGGDPDAA
jgi:hypothetical protein